MVPLLKPAALYNITLKLSPQEAACAEPSFGQFLYQDATTGSGPSYTYRFTLSSPSTPGSLIWLAVMTSSITNASVTVAPAGWNWPMQNVQTATYYTNFFWKVSVGEQTVDVQLGNNGGTRRAVFAEYAGLSNPVIYDFQNLVDDGPGYTVLPACTYPAGSAAVVAIAMTDDGPQSGDTGYTSGPGLTDRNPIDSSISGPAAARPTRDPVRRHAPRYG